MYRIARDPSGLTVDLRRRTGGRGAYLHHTQECWRRFAAQKGRVRSLGIVVDRPERVTLIRHLEEIVT